MTSFNEQNFGTWDLDSSFRLSLFLKHLIVSEAFYMLKVAP